MRQRQISNTTQALFRDMLWSPLSHSSVAIHMPMPSAFPLRSRLIAHFILRDRADKEDYVGSIQQLSQARQNESTDLVKPLQPGQSSTQLTQRLVILVKVAIEDMIANIAYFVPGQGEK